MAQTITYFGHPWQPSKDTINHLAAVIAVLITLYFWWRNTQGIHESSDDALKIMVVTTAMVVLLVVWSGTSILLKPGSQRLPPNPVPQNLSFNRDAVGWLPNIAPHALRPLPSDSSPSSALVGAETTAEEHYGLRLNAGACRARGPADRVWSFLSAMSERNPVQVNAS